MTYEDAVADSKRHKEAMIKAEEAYKKALAETVPDKPIEVIKKDNKLVEKKQVEWHLKDIFRKETVSYQRY